MDLVTWNLLPWKVLFIELVLPMTACLILSGLSAYYIPMTPTTVEEEKELQESLSFTNSVIIILFMTVMTYFIVWLYRSNCFSCIKYYIMFSMTILLSTIGAVYFITLFNTLNIIINPILFYVFIAIFTITGLFAIFKKDWMPVIVTKSYYIIISVLMSWNFSAFDLYPTFTFLFMLSIYDVLAVLSPCGPLKKLIQAMKLKKKPLTGLFFEVKLDNSINSKEVVKDVELAVVEEVKYHPVSQVDDDVNIQTTNTIADVDSSSSSSNNNNNNDNKANKLKQIQLGLGDLVFYSVLTNQALTSPKGGIVAFICCSITVLLGLLCTIYLLAKYRQPLPALPIGIVSGMLVYFIVTSVI